MKSAAVALQCSGAGAPEVVQHFYQIFFRASTVRRQPLLFPIFWAIVRYHLEKTMVVGRSNVWRAWWVG